MMRLVAILLLGLGLPWSGAWADSTDVAPPNLTLQPEVPNPPAEPGDSNKFKGLSFGVGIGVSIDLRKGRPIESVEIVNDTVRVTAERSSEPRVLLESHYFFVTYDDRNARGSTWGWGPFLAIQTGSDQLVESIGLGLLIGFRRPGVAKQGGTGADANGIGGSSFNLGIGALLDNNVKVLRAGVVENQAINAGQALSLTKTVSRWALLLTTSYSF